MENSKCFHDPIEEILEAIWVLEEKGEEANLDNILGYHQQGMIDESMVEGMVDGGLLEKEGNRYVFSEKGRERGKGIIRRHRLAERLLKDVLNIQENGSVESDACCFEHFLSPEVTDHICILLGHPRQCPHGHEIPPGPCCKRAERKVESAVLPLSEMRSGESGRILYISTKNHKRLDRLTALGLFPGKIVKVHQREPLFVIFLEETQLALEKRIVEEIYVVKS